MVAHNWELDSPKPKIGIFRWVPILTALMFVHSPAKVSSCSVLQKQFLKTSSWKNVNCWRSFGLSCCDRKNYFSPMCFRSHHRLFKRLIRVGRLHFSLELSEFWVLSFVKLAFFLFAVWFWICPITHQTFYWAPSFWFSSSDVRSVYHVCLSYVRFNWPSDFWTHPRFYLESLFAVAGLWPFLHQNA